LASLIQLDYIHHTSGRSPKIQSNTLLHAVCKTSTTLPIQFTDLYRSTTTSTPTLATPLMLAPVAWSLLKEMSSRTSLPLFSRTWAKSSRHLTLRRTQSALPTWDTRVRSTHSGAAEPSLPRRQTSLPTSAARALQLLPRLLL
jgi:hypothetical protein